MTLDELLRKIEAWAEADDNVLCLIMTGSQTQGSGQADEFSDLDIEIIAKDFEPLAGDDGWLRQFAPVWVYQPLYQDQDYPTRLVFYDGGHKVDFTLADRRRVLDMIEAGRLDDLYQRGYQVLIDKFGLTRDLPRPSGAFPVVALPEQPEFQAVVEEFWFEAAHIPKYLMRDEPWVVKFRDWTMKCMLLKLMEWHAVALSAAPVDVRYIGIHAREWTDEATWNELQHVFGHFDVADSWRALLASMRLVRRLGHEIAAASSLTYPQEVDDSISGYIMSFAERLA
jgi:aminoglycoside 6-adenylyltransferase